MEATKRECVKDAKMDGVLGRYLLNPATRVKVSVFEKPRQGEAMPNQVRPQQSEERQTAGMPNGISISNNGHMDVSVARDEPPKADANVVESLAQLGKSLLCRI